jgi:TPR repeat protein
MRIAIGVLFVMACGSREDPGAKPGGKPRECVAADCDGACEGGDPAACARASELYFDGRSGHTFDLTKSFAFAKRACDANNAFGCSLLGLHYQDGLGTEWAPAKAVAAYEKSCAAHEGVGCYNLASMYYGGHGVDADPAKGDALKASAAAYWDTACHGDQPRWCTNLAYVYADDPKKQSQVAALDKRACDAGVLVGCTELMRLRSSDDKITQANVDELVALCGKGEPYACALAGATIRAGDGVPQDPKRGFELIKQACDIGDKSSCQTMAIEHAIGKTLKQDMTATLRYANMACDRGLGRACKVLADEHHDRHDLVKFAGYALRACHMGDGGACAWIAAAYQHGEGVAQSEPDSERYTVEACRMGHLLSCGTLVQRDRELPVPPDIKRKIYTDSCNGGLKSSCARLDKLGAPK